MYSQLLFITALNLFLLIASVFGQNTKVNEISDLFRARQSKDYIPDIPDVSGVAFRDMNGDDLPDLYLTCKQGDNRLLLNGGAYRPFKDVTQIAGISGNLRPEGVYNPESGRTRYDIKRGSILVDIDNDGDADLVIAGWGISTAVYLNNGYLAFQNITDRMEIFPPIMANSCLSADINNDRYPDLLITDETQSNHLLLGDGQGFFKDVTESSGLETNGNSRGAAFSDLDLDGDLDLYVCRWNLPDLLYKNLGDGRFSIQHLPLKTLTDSLKTGSVCFGDLNNDGLSDIMVTRSDGTNFIFQNRTINSDSVWTFVDQSKLFLGNFTDNSHGAVIGDVNNDGFQDIYITNTGPNVLYINDAGTRFIRVLDITADDTPAIVVESQGAATADFDHDGDLDIFIANENNAGLLYINTLNNQNFIKIKLVGISSNRDAIGSRIELYRTDKSGQRKDFLGSREITAGSGCYSFNDPLVHFGLDTVTTVDAIIYFPSGKIIEEPGLRAGNTYIFYEYPLLPRTLIKSAQHLFFLMHQLFFWYQVILVLLFFALTSLFIRLGSKRYRWSAGTATGYLFGFFLMALVSITALRQLGFLYIFLIIDLLTIVFVAIFYVNSERIYRLRYIRERYRSVLVNLSNQIINIHDDNELFQTVVNNIFEKTEFDRVAILPINLSKNIFKIAFARGVTVATKTLNNFEFNRSLFSSLQHGAYLARTPKNEFQVYFNLLSSNILIAIGRNQNLFGILSLGSSRTISPLTTEDIEVFLSLGNQMAVAIENNDYIRQSTEMVKKLTAAEVRETYLKELEKTNTILDSKNRDLQKLYDELRNTQAQLIHSEKMASLGQLVAGISHELNNPISFIYANVKQLKTYTEKIENFTSLFYEDKGKGEKLDQNGPDQILSILPDLKNLITDTINGSQMVKNLVDNLRRFSHLDQAKWKEIDIHSGIDSSLMILNPQIKHRIDIIKEFHVNTQVECNPGQINQVFLNLLSNAAQSIADKGTITIKTTEDKNFIYIEFSDSGTGIPQEILSKIFDPFFTTKDVGQGTGLGLSISYSIIKDHNGRIEVKSKVGAGSTFTVVLPKTHGNFSVK